MNAMMGSGPLVSDADNTARAAAAAIDGARAQALHYGNQERDMCDDELRGLMYDDVGDEDNDNIYDDTLDFLPEGESNLHRSPSSQSIFSQ